MAEHDPLFLNKQLMGGQYSNYADARIGKVKARCYHCVNLDEALIHRFYAGMEDDSVNESGRKIKGRPIFVNAYRCKLQNSINSPNVPACLKFVPRETPWMTRGPDKVPEPEPSDHSLNEWIDEEAL